MATKLYDAIVSPNIGEGDYLLPSEAFNDGKTSIFVREGKYVEEDDVNIPDGGSMVGETRSGVLIDFSGTAYGVKCNSNPATIQTAGTISLTQNSATVTGTGTSFTSLAVDDFISIGTLYAKIATITNNTTLSLAYPYRGAPLTDITYQALTMFTGVSINNISILGSTSTGLHIKGCRLFTMECVTVIACTPNILIEYSGDAGVRQITSFHSTGIGYSLSNTVSLSNAVMEIINSSSHGISITGNTIGLLFNDTESSNNGGSGVYIAGTAIDANFNKCVCKANVDTGIYTNGSTYGALIDESNFSHNGSYGADLNGDDIIFKGNLVQYNGDHGIVVNGDECIITCNVCKYNTEAIRVSGSSNIVSNNICRNSVTYAAHLMSGATDNIVSYNNLTLAGDGTLNDEGDSSLTEGNKA